MELVEKIEDINEWLKRDFGCHVDGRPWFRVVFAYDQLEKRWMSHTDEGFQLINPEVRLVPKYRHYIGHEMYVLERIVTIMPGVETDLVEREPYEVMWTFMDRHGKYLPPRYAVAKIVIEQVFLNKMRGIRKIENEEDAISEEQRLDEMEQMLFGDEESITSHTVAGFHEENKDA